MTDIVVDYEDNINSYSLDDFDDTYNYTNSNLPDYSEDPIEEDDEESVNTNDTYSLVGKKKNLKRKRRLIKDIVNSKQRTEMLYTLPLP